MIAVSLSFIGHSPFYHDVPELFSEHLELIALV